MMVFPGTCHRRECFPFSYTRCQKTSEHYKNYTACTSTKKLRDPGTAGSRLNPVRAGIVAGPADYPWSSHRAHAERADDPVVRDHALFAALGVN
jgi:hypothetical protein